MKKIYLMICLLTLSSLWAQHTQDESTVIDRQNHDIDGVVSLSGSYYDVDTITINQDQLIKITYAKVAEYRDSVFEGTIPKDKNKASEYSIKNQAVYLFKKDNDKTELLLSVIPDTELSTEEFPEKIVSLSNFEVDDVLARLSGKPWDTFGKKSSNVGQIKQIKGSVFQASNCYYSYVEGTPHGFGFWNYSFYDYATNKKFGYADVFKESAMEKIYKYIKKEHKEIVSTFGMSEKEELALVKSTKELTDSEYTFTPEGLLVMREAQSSLWGWDKKDNNYHSFLIPYSYLKKDMKKDSPIWKMIHE